MENTSKYTTCYARLASIEIDWSNDGIRLVYPGPMMGIDRVQPHDLIGKHWARNQSTVDRI